MTSLNHRAGEGSSLRATTSGFAATVRAAVNWYAERRIVWKFCWSKNHCGLGDHSSEMMAYELMAAM